MKLQSLFILIFLSFFSFLKLSSKEYSLEDALQDSYKARRPMFIWDEGNSYMELGFNSRNEGFYGSNTALLSGSFYDQVLYFQDTSDLTLYVNQNNTVRGRIGIRNKFRVGEPFSLGKTSDSTFKIADALAEGKHNHYVGKLLLWIREAWFEGSLNKIFGLECKNNHYFKIGVFPFQVGRGISLGDAYAVAPGVLGFYSNNVIDQYAYGALAHGDVYKSKSLDVEYDVYMSVLRNLSGNFADVNEKVYSKVPGRKDNPRRGFGEVNLAFASRFIALFKSNSKGCGDVRVEPYIFINHDPEQQVEFPSDAESKLATLGIAADYLGNRIEIGFEAAANFGNQTIKPWDRNKVSIINNDGTAAFQYSKVLDGDPLSSGSSKVLANKSNKSVVDNTPGGYEFNGLELGSSGLYNSLDRFREGYVNEYTGAMLVADLTLKYSENVRLSTELNFATGDENPNVDKISIGDSRNDRDYQGFIPFQSNYSGRKVASAFFLGSGRVARPLTVPPRRTSEESRTASVESGFTNLALWGVGADILKKPTGRRARFRPNMYFGWQSMATRKFDFESKSTIDEPADKYLGFELNIFSEIELYKNLKLFCVSGIFFPGNHFNDIKGKPLTEEQFSSLSKPACDGLFTPQSPPLLSNHKAFLLNIGIIYSF